jgi:hypothetical protein
MFFPVLPSFCTGSKAHDEVMCDFYSKEPSTEEKMLFLFSADA